MQEISSLLMDPGDHSPSETSDHLGQESRTFHSSTALRPKHKMDVEKTPENAGSIREPDMVVVSEPFPKTSEPRPLREGMDDSESNINISDTAVPDRLQGLKLYSLTLAFVVPSTYSLNMLIHSFQDVSQRFPLFT